MNAPARAAQASPRKRGYRLRVFALLLLALFIAFAFGIRTLLQPRHLIPILLDRLGEATGLVITAKGESSYGWEPIPRIVLRDVDARQPGATTPVLRAERVLLSLPWETLKSRGKSLVIDRIELDAPVLDLAAMQRWQASRPKAESRLPDLERGIRIVRGQLLGEGWRVVDLEMDAPAFHPGQPVQALANGRFEQSTLSLSFKLAIAASKTRLPVGIGINGFVEPTTRDWHLPARIRLRGFADAKDGAVTLVPGNLGASVRYVDRTQDIPLIVGAHGHWRLDHEGVTLDPAALALRAQEPIPSFNARGRVHVGNALKIALEGVLPGWLKSWPGLPAPLDRSRSPLPFALAYDGATDVSDPISLRLRRDVTRFDGRFRFRDVLTWSKARNSGSPIPPLDGHLVTPRLEISGATLEGVEVFTDEPSVR